MSERKRHLKKPEFPELDPERIEAAADKVLGRSDAIMKEQLPEPVQFDVELSVKFRFFMEGQADPVPDNHKLWLEFSSQFANQFLEEFEEWLNQNHPVSREEPGIRSSCIGLFGDAIKARFQKAADYYYRIAESEE